MFLHVQLKVSVFDQAIWNDQTNIWPDCATRVNRSLWTRPLNMCKFRTKFSNCILSSIIFYLYMVRQIRNLLGVVTFWAETFSSTRSILYSPILPAHEKSRTIKSGAMKLFLFGCICKKKTCQTLMAKHYILGPPLCASL